MKHKPKPLKYSEYRNGKTVEKIKSRKWKRKSIDAKKSRNRTLRMNEDEA